MSAVFGDVEQVADAVMYEGYVLYPYRASAMKNRCRWQFGVLAPRTCAERTGADPWHVQTECLVEGSPQARVSVKVRCLQLQRRTVEARVEDPAGWWRPCERLVVDGHELLSWDEAVACAIACPPVTIGGPSVEEFTMPFDIAAWRRTELAGGATSALAARLVRERWPVTAVIRIASQRAGEAAKVRVRVENLTAWPESGPDDRAVALRHSLLGCHTLLHVEDGRFLSSIDPPSHAAALSRSCANENAWPVLAGAPGSSDVMLSSPIILYDYPAVAPESRDRFFDGTEIDEMLALRVLTMTEAEKREAAATDASAAVIVQRTAGDSDAALHGAIRSFEELLNPPGPGPERDFVEIGTVRVSRGSRVRLAPRRRADSMDMFLAGRIATVSAVHRDLENAVHLAVTVDADPGADLHAAYGRYFYFSPDEVHPVGLEVDGDPGV